MGAIQQTTAVRQKTRRLSCQFLITRFVSRIELACCVNGGSDTDMGNISTSLPEPPQALMHSSSSSAPVSTISATPTRRTSSPPPSSSTALDGEGYIRRVKLLCNWKKLQKGLEWDRISQFAVLTGINGCGKTALLECLSKYFDKKHGLIVGMTDKDLYVDYGTTDPFVSFLGDAFAANPGTKSYERYQSGLRDEAKQIYSRLMKSMLAINPDDTLTWVKNLLRDLDTDSPSFGNEAIQLILNQLEDNRQIHVHELTSVATYLHRNEQKLQHFNDFLREEKTMITSWQKSGDRINQQSQTAFTLPWIIKPKQKEVSLLEQIQPSRGRAYSNDN